MRAEPMCRCRAHADGVMVWARKRGLATPSPDGEGDISSLSPMIMPLDS